MGIAHGLNQLAPTDLASGYFQSLDIITIQGLTISSENEKHLSLSLEKKGTRMIVHLCILHHGLWGNAGHLKYLGGRIRDKHQESVVLGNIDINHGLRYILVLIF